MTYARIFNGMFYTVVTDEQYAALPDEDKALHRPLEVDPEPAVTPQQRIEHGGYDVQADRVVQRWTVRDKTAGELDAETNRSERDALRAVLTALNNDIQAYNATPNTSGTTAERLTRLEARVADIERQQRRANTILRHYLRGL